MNKPKSKGKEKTSGKLALDFSTNEWVFLDNRGKELGRKKGNLFGESKISKND